MSPLTPLWVLILAILSSISLYKDVKMSLVRQKGDRKNKFLDQANGTYRHVVSNFLFKIINQFASIIIDQNYKY